MPAIQPTFFSRPEMLQRMKVSSLHQLFEPFETYLKSRGIVFPISFDNEINKVMLAEVLASHRCDTPPELVEQLELVALLASSSTVQQLELDCDDVLARLRTADDSPADIAVKLLKSAPELAWREFDRQALNCRRSFTSYHPMANRRFLGVNDKNVATLESLLSPWFGKNARSNWCKIRPHEDADSITFMIRHGDLLARISALNDDGSIHSHLLRPERFDIVRYLKATQEWQLAGIGARIQSEYRYAFSEVFYGNESALVCSQRYSLAPLLDGSSCLNCHTRGAIAHVALKSVTMMRPNKQKVTITGGNVFDEIGSQSKPIRILEATLAIKLVGRRQPVSVTINEERETIKISMNIAAVFAWLEDAGFCVEGHYQDDLLATA